MISGYCERTRFAWALPATVAAGIWSVSYELVNLSTFDRTAPLNTLHEPWTPVDHFFLVHLTHFGVWETVTSVAFSIFLFSLCALLLVLRPFILPPRSEESGTGAGAPVEPSDMSVAKRR
jgi:hypothetical protein